MSPRYDEVADVQLPTRRPRPEPVPDQATPPSAATRLVTITVAVPEETRRQVRIRCAEQGIKIQQAVDEALQAWLARNPEDQ